MKKELGILDRVQFVEDRKSDESELIQSLEHEERKFEKPAPQRNFKMR